MSTDPDHQLIDAKLLVSRYSVEELAATAEDYFARITDPWYHTVKPFASPEECPDNLGSFGALIFAAELRKGDQVLDFAAGTCWTSRYLAQMGCNVVASDISDSALAIGQKALERLPLVEPHGSIDFLKFDGFSLSLPDESIDRVICLDAFHHVVNQRDVMQELLRTLKPGGILAMSEPGPSHSKSPQSQFEMRNYRVVEQDIVVEEICSMAKQLGFVDCEVAIYNPRPHFVPADMFETSLETDENLIAGATRRFMENHRLIRMRKRGQESKDSRSRAHLGALLKATTDGARIIVTARNTGGATWLSSGTDPGSVNLGIHTMKHDGTVLDLDFHRVACVESVVHPGEEISVTFSLPSLPTEVNTIEIDLVAEHVSWFANVGTTPVRLNIR